MATDPLASENDFKSLLEAWGLKEYISKFDDEGYDDPKDWIQFCKDDDGTKLEEEGLISKKGHRKKFVKKWRQTFDKDEEKNNGNPNREIFPDGINIVPFKKQEYQLPKGGKGFAARNISILTTCRDKIYSLAGKKDVKPGTGARMEKSKRAPEKLFCSEKHKIILVCGKTGVGKSTLINSMMNYVYDVQYNDKFRLKLIEEEKKKDGDADSVTQHISSYKIKQPKGGNINYDLTIIDTPGFGDSKGVEKDKQIAEEFKYILDNILTEINGICFVVRSADTRLDASQTYVFNSILNLWAKDISKNIFILMTFADSGGAKCIDALNKHDILKHVKKRISINNCAFTDDPLNSDSTSMFGAAFWDMGIKCLKTFFDELNNIKPQSTKNSKQVLQQRGEIQAKIDCISRNLDYISEREAEINREQEFIKKHEDDINAGKEVVYYTKTQVWVKMKVSDKVVNCNNCHPSCHVGCWGSNPSVCCVMSYGFGSKCKICGCAADDHVCEEYQWKLKTEKVKKSNWDDDKDLKNSYEKATQDKQLATNRMTTLKDELKQLKQESIYQLAIIKNLQNELAKIALRPQCNTVGNYINQLIENENENPHKIKYLNKLKQQEDAIDKIAEIKNVNNITCKDLKMKLNSN